MQTSIQDFTDIIAWQKIHELTLSAYRLTNGFPKQEIFGIVSQMRRCGVYLFHQIWLKGLGEGLEQIVCIFTQLPKAHWKNCAINYYSHVI